MGATHEYSPVQPDQPEGQPEAQHQSQPTHEYSPVQPDQPEVQQQPSNCFGCCVLLSTMVILIVSFSYAFGFLADQAFSQVPHYSVAINHVSGLDPTDLGHGTSLEPEFNLTLRVSSRAHWATVCAEPHMYATVSYRGVSLAASATSTQEICAKPMDVIEHHLVATGAGVVVPGSVLDSLAMDMRSGVPEFDVELHGPGPMHMAWECGPRVVGDIGALQMQCNILLGRHTLHNKP